MATKCLLPNNFNRFFSVPIAVSSSSKTMLNKRTSEMSDDTSSCVSFLTSSFLGSKSISYLPCCDDSGNATTRLLMSRRNAVGAHMARSPALGVIKLRTKLTTENATTTHASQRDARDHPGNIRPDRKSTRLNSSHLVISYAVFCLKTKNNRHSQL